MNRSACMAVVMAVVMAAGCRGHATAPAATQPAPTPAIRPMALVDVVQVIKAMGWATELHTAIGIADRQLQAERDQQYSDLYHQAMTERRQIVKAAKLTPDQASRVLNLQNAAQLEDLPLTAAQRQELVSSSLKTVYRAEQVRQDYQKKLKERSYDLAAAYRAMIVPAAQRVAAKTGFRTVVVDSADVVYHDPSVDVTQRVIDELNSGKPKWEQ